MTLGELRDKAQEQHLLGFTGMPLAIRIGGVLYAVEAEQVHVLEADIRAGKPLPEAG